MYKSVKIVAGKGGWGGPLVLVPTETRCKIVSVTGGGIHPLAAKIAEETGCAAVDGFTTGVPDEEILLAVVDCGGTARCGVYPKKGILTANVLPVGKSKAQAKAEVAAIQAGREKNFVTRLGIAIGGIVNKFYAAGRETIDITVKSILPFMAFVSMILGIISVSGLGNVIANTISPLASSLPGMLVISLICAIPFISPVLGPGAVIAQVVGTLLGAQIGMGNIPPQYALPALFAINAQVGADFVPVGLSLGEADPETIELGVPAVLYSRVITGPLAVLIAYAASIGLY